MMIMDAGVHVWRPQAPDRPWMPGRKAHLPEPVLDVGKGAKVGLSTMSPSCLLTP